MNYVAFFTTFAILGTLVSTILMVLLVLSKNVFIYAFATYIMGISIYLFAFDIKNRRNLIVTSESEKVQYYTSTYVSLFNTILTLFVILVCIIMDTVFKSKKYY